MKLCKMFYNKIFLTLLYSLPYKNNNIIFIYKKTYKLSLNVSEKMALLQKSGEKDILLGYWDYLNVN